MSVDEGHKIEFEANPTQKQFIESRAEADLFDSRKGEGKSTALVWACFYHTLHNPGANWVFIRDTFENLRRTTMAEFFQWFPDGVFGRYVAGEKMWLWDTERTGLKGKIYFMGVEDEGDASKIASMPLAGLAIDEPSPAAGSSSGVSEFVFDTAFAQLRQPGMNWYAAKLAQNNPDETHWTYRRFWEPGTPGVRGAELPPLQESGFRAWQTKQPENTAHLPAGYYDRMKRSWGHRPDLLRRFVEGKHGYQQVGKAVTPQWSDDIHLSDGLKPVKGVPLQILYDGGLNPTAIITQITPMGHWLVLESFVGDGIGMYELITDTLKPALNSRYRGFKYRHIGDPALASREQSSSMQTAAKVIRKELGGAFIKGPVKPSQRIDPLQKALSRQRGGQGMVMVDRHKAKEVWHALRGGYHYHVSRGGVVGDIKKNMHSHPGDAMGYGAAILLPTGEMPGQSPQYGTAKPPGYFGTAPGTSLGMAKPGIKVPKAAHKIGGS